MILVDKNIEELVSKHQLIIEGFNRDNLGSISYDLTIDSIISSDKTTKSKCDLAPGEFVFIQSKELLHIPNNILGRIAQKNSRMRMGLYVDGPHYHPGHKTYAYLRVWNNTASVITLNEGDRIAQIIFEELKEVPTVTYGESESDAFADEVKFLGLSKYKAEYEQYIQKIETVSNRLEDKET